MSLTFDVLRNANVTRQATYRNSKGEVVPSAEWTPADWLQALVGELGEYANFRKKFQRGDITEEQFNVEAKKELADVLIYLDLLANSIDVDLGQATLDKFNEVSHRVGSSVFIAVSGTHHYDIGEQVPQ